MRRATFLALFVVAVLSGSVAAPRPALGTLKVIYVGEEPTSVRAVEFTEFLQKRVGRLEVVSRRTFQPTQARDADVVLLDWPQSGLQEFKHSPLGDRSTWAKPTVLLGSAGLNLAVNWQIRGGSG